MSDIQSNMNKNWLDKSKVDANGEIETILNMCDYIINNIKQNEH